MREALDRPGLTRIALRRGQVRWGLALIGAILAIAVFGPYLAPWPPTDFAGVPSAIRVDGTLFGTDHLGQDVWSRFLHGGRSIIVLTTVATVIGVLVGAGVGLYAAATGGAAESFVSSALDVMLAVPQLLVVLVATTIVGPRPTLVIAAVAVTTATRVARVLHGAAVVVVGQDFVQMSRALGESRWYVIRADLLPNVAGALAVEVSIRFAYAVGIVSSLAFLGFVPRVNEANWGVMVQENRAAVGVQPWGVVLPSVAITLLVVGFGLVADGVGREVAAVRRQREAGS